jgi:serine protease Do
MEVLKKMGVKLKDVSKRFLIARALVLMLAFAIAGMGPGVFAQAQQPQLPSPADLSRTFVSVAKQVKPAVVSIDVVEKTKRSSSMRLPEGFPQIPGFPSPNTPRRRQGTGSGVIISPDGYIVTNNHVVGEADQITVKLADGREFKNAKRVGTDPETDIAVVKIDAQNLPFAKLGNSDALEQGEWVIALGSPFGLQHTMTAGIVSALGRDLGAGAGQFTDFIQTDAAINPGNSGGPLINMQGEVIGINTLIFSQSGSNSGVGFAIPANLANKVYAQLVKTGRVTRGYLGVMLQPVTPAIARTIGYEKAEGALVGDLARNDSPAAKAGLRSGDVIVEFDGKPVKSPKTLTEMVADTPVGKAIRLKYLREGRPETATVTLGERPATTDVAGGEETPEEQEDGGRLGISMNEVTPELARQMKLKVASGVVIQNVDADGPASEAGLQRGDVIHRVNRTPINTRQDLVRALAALKGEKEVVLQVERGGQLSFFSVTLE